MLRNSSGTTKKRILKLVKLALAVIIFALFVQSAFAGSHQSERRIRILFTSDIHSYLFPVRSKMQGKVREHGGAARLKTLIDRYRDENSVYLDCGDFSMGTPVQSDFAGDAFELRMLGTLGCDVVTFGNHEFDYGTPGLDSMLKAAVSSGDRLPAIVESSISFEGELSEDQKLLKNNYDSGLVQRAITLEVNGMNITVFGLMGEDAVECAPESGQIWRAAKDTAKLMVQEYGDSSDLLICLSHSGTKGDGSEGEDAELAKEVPGIDVIISGHTHSVLKQAALVNGSIIASCGEYASYLGVMDLIIAEDGGVSLANYELVSCDESVEEDPAIAEKAEAVKAKIDEDYLSKYGYTYDEPIAYSNFDFMSLEEMLASHQEYNIGNLIADSYIFTAKKNGIEDIDVAIVSFGTIRSSILEGPVTAADAFRICSLGMGEDGSAGHAIVSAYLSGRELKLLVEIDATLGEIKDYVRMSYSGLHYRFNTKRIPMDRVTSVGLDRGGGIVELLEDDMLYKVCCNMYAANMLGMVNNLSKGILKIEPKFEDGSLVDDFKKCRIKTPDGAEIKEWTALAGYMASFMHGESGLPEIPDLYSSVDGRKVKYEEGGLAVINSPGPVAQIMIGAVLLGLVLVVIIIFTVRRMLRRAAEKRRADFRE